MSEQRRRDAEWRTYSLEKIARLEAELSAEKHRTSNWKDIAAMAKEERDAARLDAKHLRICDRAHEDDDGDDGECYRWCQIEGGHDGPCEKRILIPVLEPLNRPGERVKCVRCRGLFYATDSLVLESTGPTHGNLDRCREEMGPVQWGRYVTANKGTGGPGDIDG